MSARHAYDAMLAFAEEGIVGPNADRTPAPSSFIGAGASPPDDQGDDDDVEDPEGDE